MQQHESSQEAVVDTHSKLKYITFVEFQTLWGRWKWARGIDYAVMSV